MRRHLPALLTTLLVAACAATPPASPAPTIAPTSTASPSPSPSPTALPPAADGAGLSACADGTCEVRVARGDRIPVPRAAGRTLTVSVIDGPVIVLDGVYLGGTISSGGACDLCHVQAVFPTDTQPGSVKATLGQGGELTLGGIVVQVVAVLAPGAVLRIRTA